MEKKIIDFKCDIKLNKQDDDRFTVEGMASTDDLDLVNDVVMPGAFNEALKTREPKILYQHDQQKPIGIAGDIKQTKDGLFLSAKLSNTLLVRETIIPLIKDGVLDSFSIGFYVDPIDITYKNNVRYINKAELYEVSIVTFPAQPNAKITNYKNLDEQIEDCFSKLKADLDRSILSKIEQLSKIIN